MKWCLFFFLFFTLHATAQHRFDHAEIDARAATIDAPTPLLLAGLLTTPYSTEEDKARSIFSWIGQHIAYNTFIIPSLRPARSYFTEPEDSCTVWASAVEMTAIRTLRRRMAICDGYSKLFKTLCDYAGLKSEVITGFARGYSDSKLRFRTNHSWNAVQIDGRWQLLDVTWGSGFVTDGGFVQHLDHSFFMVSPEKFIEDHEPEDQFWTLLTGDYPFEQYKKSPFAFRTYVKYGFDGIAPANGVVTQKAGDTIVFRLSLRDSLRSISIASDHYIEKDVQDSLGNCSYLLPFLKKGREVVYNYVVNDKEQQWVTLIYNGDPVLRYRVRLSHTPCDSRTYAVIGR